jgi:hypothetical protein
MNYTFTPDQTKHAQQVAMMLWRKRFFLPSNVDRRKPLPLLPADTFEHLYEQNRKLKDLYENVARNTKNHLLEEEHAMWLEPPKLQDGQRIADTNLFGSGLDIVAIVPLQALLVGLPLNSTRLAIELMLPNYPTAVRDNMSPNDIKQKRTTFMTYAHSVYADLAALTSYTHENKVMVVMETRFEPTGDAYPTNDFMKNKVTGLITYPHLTSYLMYKQALGGTRFSEKAFTIFTSLKSGHIAIEYDDKAPRLIPNQKHGYDCKISFATIL